MSLVNISFHVELIIEETTTFIKSIEYKLEKVYIIGGKPKDFNIKAKDTLPTIKICEECCCECGRYIKELKEDEKV